MDRTTVDPAPGGPMTARPVADDLRRREVDLPLGRVTVVVSARGVSGLYLPGHRPAPRPALLGEPATDDVRLHGVIEQLHAYFDGRLREFTVPLDLRGTDFQQAVWSLVRDIPYGTVVTYGELARRAGRPTAVRAVAAANARNPVSILVPCHRVVGSDGSLTGYAGGVDRKRALLELEQVRPLPGEPSGRAYTAE